MVAAATVPAVTSLCHPAESNSRDGINTTLAFAHLDLTFSSDQKLSFRLSSCLLLSLSVTKSSSSESDMSLVSVKKR